MFSSCRLLDASVPLSFCSVSTVCASARTMSSLPVCFLFSAFFVSVVLSKFVHLCTYVSTIPTGAFLLYLPTFFITDFLVICIARLFLRPVKGLPSLVGAVIGSFIT